MFKQDERFDTPPDDAKIWRYMDHDKLEDLLTKSILYFPTIKRLAKSDPYEGSSYACGLLNQIDPEAARDFAQKMRSCGQPVAVNCWHLNEGQSMAMWKIYSATKGLAIQSTVGRLKKSLENNKDSIYIAKVIYTNGTISQYPDLFMASITKRKCWDYEKELRLFVWDTSEIKRKSNGDAIVPINKDILIESVYISPTSGQKEINQAISLLKKYQPSVKPTRTNLLTSPMF